MTWIKESISSLVMLEDSLNVRSEILEAHFYKSSAVFSLVQWFPNVKTEIRTDTRFALECYVYVRLYHRAVEFSNMIDQKVWIVFLITTRLRE